MGEAKEGCERGKMKVREECDGEAEKNGAMRWRIVRHWVGEMEKECVAGKYKGT